MQYLLANSPYRITDITYQELVRFYVEVDDGSQEIFEKWLVENTNAEATCKKEGKYFIERAVE